MTQAEFLRLKLYFNNRPAIRYILRLWFPRMPVSHFKRRQQFSSTFPQAYLTGDGPGADTPSNLHQIPDAVPRNEPLHRSKVTNLAN